MLILGADLGYLPSVFKKEYPCDVFLLVRKYLFDHYPGMNGTQWGRYCLMGVVALIAPVVLSTGVQGQDLDPPQGLFADHWYEVRLSGQQAGYMNLTLRREGDVIHTISDTIMLMAREGMEMEVRARSETHETVDGEPLSFRSAMQMGQQPVWVSGVIRDGRVYVEMEQGGVIMEEDYLFAQNSVMSWGMDRKILALGRKRGTSIRVNFYSPDIRVDGPIDAVVEVGEGVVFSDNPFGGSGISTTEYITRLSVGAVEIVSRSWLDADGVMIKTVMPFGGMEMSLFKVSSEEALEPFYPPEVFENSLLPVDGPAPADSRVVIYRLKRTDEGVLGPHLMEHPTQMVEFISDREVLVTVLRPDFAAMAAESGNDPEPDSAYLRSNLYINADDPVILELANQATAGIDGKDGFAVADALRRFVTEFIEDKNLSVGFATASEVARQPEGDCTEHAVLLAAFGRAVGIPARVVAGLVIFPGDGSPAWVAGFHMWTQFYVNGRWVDLDAAMDETECGPTRIAFYAGSLDSTTLNEMSFNLLDIMGRIELEVDLAH